MFGATLHIGFVLMWWWWLELTLLPFVDGLPPKQYARTSVARNGVLSEEERKDSTGWREAKPGFDFDRDTFVNIHIPKAGGTYFESMLGRIESPVGCYLTAATGACGGKKKTKWTDLQSHQLPKEAAPGQYCCPRYRLRHRTWLYARPSLGFSWGAGVHAGYERTRACVNNPGKYRALDPPVRDNQPVSKRPGMIKLQRIMPWYRWDAPREDGRVFYISMMRDPVQRTLSEFFHSFEGWKKCSPEEPSCTTIRSDFYCDESIPIDVEPCNSEEVLLQRGNTTVSEGKGKGLKRWLLCRGGASQHHNRQSRMLAHSMPCMSRAQSGQLLARTRYRAMQEQQAIETITQGRVFVGIFERFAESIEYFERALGITFKWDPTSYRPPKDYGADPILEEQIDLLEAADRRVYTEANKHLTSELARLRARDGQLG